MEYVVKTGKPYRKLIDAEKRNWSIICLTDFSIPGEVRKEMCEKSQNYKLVKFKGVSNAWKTQKR